MPANILGGLGSGIAYAGGDTFLAVPDRGPNAVPFNSKIDNTASYINRFQTLKLNLTANPGGAASRYSYAYPDEDDPALQLDAAYLRNAALGLGVGPGRRLRTRRTSFISPAGPTILGPAVPR